MNHIRILVWLFLISFLPLLSFSQENKCNEDKPKYGEIDLKLKKLWEHDKANGKALQRLAELRTLNNGIVVHDFKNKESYIFDADGSLVTTFAQEGENEGQVNRYLNCFISNNKIFVGSPNKLFIYNKEGAYEKAIDNNLFLKFPVAFLSNAEFIYASNDPTGNELLIKKFSIEGNTTSDFAKIKPKKPLSGPGGMIVLGITPQLIGFYDAKTNNLVYGYNDSYNLRSLKNDIEFEFNINRIPNAINTEIKQEYFKDIQIPEESKNALINSLADTLTYFQKIQMTENYICVFTVDEFTRKKSAQWVDLFSKEGEYLYRGKIEFPGNYYLANTDNVGLIGDNLYVILKNEEGQDKLVKYEVKLPKKK